nr:neutral zinc metallopeptidase [Sabulicella rubraurantiaca]
MRMDDERESQHIEDRRGGGFSMGRGGIAGGGIGVLVVAVLAMFMGVDPGVILSQLDGGAPPSRQAPAERPPAEDAHARFVSRVLASTEDVWTAEFRRSGREYEAPRLVLFSGAVQSGCGGAQAAMGPFYCPLDKRVYIDLSFFRDMERRMGAGGDFAQAYVIAHEVGHHVQNVLGLLPRSQEAQRRAEDRAEANAISVRVELMADCLAGFWARRADQMRGILEAGDIEEGMNAAAAVGDDRLQQGRGAVVPESFTHGTSQQRVSWFRRGLQAENAAACDTFAR